VFFELCLQLRGIRQEALLADVGERVLEELF